MSMDESVKRLRNSLIQPDYFWWHGKDILPLLEEIKELGVQHARVEAHLGLDEDGSPDIHFTLRDTRTGRDCGECFNYSHVCPPDCG